MLGKFKEYLSVFSDLMLTIIVPVVLYIISQSHNAEVNAMQAKIDSLEVLSYGNLPAFFKGKELMDNEKKEFLKQRIQMLGGEFDFESLDSRYLCLKLNDKPEK